MGKFPILGKTNTSSKLSDKGDSEPTSQSVMTWTMTHRTIGDEMAEA